MLWATASDFPVSLNGVVRLDPSTPADHVIAVADGWFGARGTGYTVNAVDGADDDLRAAAEAAGLLVLRDSPQMVCDGPVAPPDAGPRARARVGRPGRRRSPSSPSSSTPPTSRSARRPGRSVRASWPSTACSTRTSRPCSPCSTARPVACAQLLLSHGIGGVYYVGTLEAARGRGLGELVTAAVTNRGFERGAAFGRPPGLADGRGASTAAWATATSTARPASSASRPPPPDHPRKVAHQIRPAAPREPASGGVGYGRREGGRSCSCTTARRLVARVRAT